MSIHYIYVLYLVKTLNIQEGWSADHRILSESCRYVNCITWYEVHFPLFIWWTDPINNSLRWWFLKHFIIWCLRMYIMYIVSRAACPFACIFKIQTTFHRLISIIGWSKYSNQLNQKVTIDISAFLTKFISTCT